MDRQYVYRNYPCTIGNWYVEGEDKINGGGGVLEWCSSKVDADEMYYTMIRTGEFSGLATGYWTQNSIQHFH